MFITFEGGEGAGKSTQMELIAEELLRRGKSVLKTREPGGTHLGNVVRGWVLNHAEKEKLVDKAELFLFLAARSQHVEQVIKPALAAGHIVLCDRFNDSTVVYQGVARGLGIEQVQALCLFACSSILPKVTLLLDLDPAIGLLRSQKAHKENAEVGKLDRIESETLSFHRKVREGFHQLWKENPGRIKKIDATKSPEEVFKECLKQIDSLWLNYA